MNLDQLKKIIDQGESDTVEFKKSTGLLSAAFKTVCAFLNGEGGIILIGITEQGKIVGQDVSDNTRREIAKEISDIEPSAQSHIAVSYVPVDDKKQVVVIKVGSGSHMPYAWDGRPFHRVQSTSPRMPQHRYEQLIVQRGQLNHSWEGFLAEDCLIRDLDENMIWTVVNDAVRAKRLSATVLRESATQVLQGFKLVNDSKQLLNAAMVLFGRSLFPKYAQCQLKVARFKGIDKSEFLDSDKIYGNLFELFAKGEAFIQKHLPLAAKIVPGKFQRVETPLIPFMAFREAFLNALCHHDYGVSNGYISLAIYDDRMEIINSGGLLPGVTLEKIKRGCSKLRNKLIAEVLYKCKYIEAWGRGIKSIIDVCKEAKVPEPEFEVDDLEFKIIFNFPHSIKPEAIVLESAIEKLTKRQQDILKILVGHGSSSLKEIASRLSTKLAARTLRDDLAYLKKQKLVSLEGFGRGARWFLASSKKEKV